MLIEIHMIQNHSPSNLNRDDLGAPKTCIFGGVTRARISSQCLKRSIRNPGNPDNIHNREPGLFAQAMGEHIGTRTKLFPWLVKQALEKLVQEDPANPKIPLDEHRRIVLAAQRIAVSNEKDEKKTSAAGKSDTRQKTRQLIHLGHRHATLFVQTLVELREQKDRYDYFLNPKVGFREMVRGLLGNADIEEKDEKDLEKVVKASWTIAICRMAKLLKAPEGEAPDPEPELEEDGQPGIGHATFIAERVWELRSTDPKRFTELTTGPSKEESAKIKGDAPPEPKGMNIFRTGIETVLRGDAVDIALFGRMTTSESFEDVAAAMQVAHAISTHGVVNEVDYFTAVDDLGKGVAAGHVGEAQYNSACFYKYFCLDWDQHLTNLAGPDPLKPKKPSKPKEPQDDATPEKRKKYEEDQKQYEEDMKRHPELVAAYEKAVEKRPETLNEARRLAAAALGHFLIAAARTTPSGKQNSFAANNEPTGILVEIKKEAKTPTSYANAFAEPARKIGDPPDDAADCVSLVGRSIAQLGDHVHNVRRALQTASTVLWFSPAPWRYPLQGWEREEDGRKAKVRDAKNQPTDKDKPPVPVASKTFDVLDHVDPKHPCLVQAVIDALEIKVDGADLKWADVKDAGKKEA